MLCDLGQVRLEWGKELIFPTQRVEPLATGAHLKTEESWPQNLPRARPVGEGLKERWGGERRVPYIRPASSVEAQSCSED